MQNNLRNSQHSGVLLNTIKITATRKEISYTTEKNRESRLPITWPESEYQWVLQSRLTEPTCCFGLITEMYSLKQWCILNKNMFAPHNAKHAPIYLCFRALKLQSKHLQWQSAKYLDEYFQSLLSDHRTALRLNKSFYYTRIFTWIIYIFCAIVHKTNSCAILYQIMQNTWKLFINNM
jgi:hypothetical protein